jgi:hypothetical protein
MRDKLGKLADELKSFRVGPVPWAISASRKCDPPIRRKWVAWKAFPRYVPAICPSFFRGGIHG